MRATFGYVGHGRTVHLIASDDRPACGVKGGTVTPSDGAYTKVTCKRCLKMLATLAAMAELEAHSEDARRDLEAQRETAAAAHVHGLTMSARQRRAARRSQAAQLRAQAAETRSVARARRAKRNGTPAAARTLLVAAGLPDDLAKRYAPAFSRGVETANPATSKRVRTGAHRSKRVAVRVFTAAEFAGRLAAYRPKNPAHAQLFALAG